VFWGFHNIVFTGIGVSAHFERTLAFGDRHKSPGFVSLWWCIDIFLVWRIAWGVIEMKGLIPYWLSSSCMIESRLVSLLGISNLLLEASTLGVIPDENLSLKILSPSLHLFNKIGDPKLLSVDSRILGGSKSSSKVPNFCLLWIIPELRFSKWSFKLRWLLKFAAFSTMILIIIFTVFVVWLES